MHLPDLNSPENIDNFVYAFYQKILQDDLLKPIFLDEAKVNMLNHLPLVSLYWQKILLGDKRYRNNTINIHRGLNSNFPLKEQHYQRWLTHFQETANTHYYGCCKDKAVRVAQTIIDNMQNLFLSVTTLKND